MMEEISYEELKRAYDDLSDNYSILQTKLGKALQDLDNANNKYHDLKNSYTLLANHYNDVVKQNQSLQQELRNKDSGESTK